MRYYSANKAACLALALAMAAAAVAVAPCAAQNSAQDFLDLHNEARNDVGVGPVSWDDGVAAFAQSYAAERQGDCALQHSGGGPNGYGENIYEGDAGKAWSASDAMKSWLEEEQWYDYDSNTCSPPEGETCLHYTQVVWSASTAVGCARVDCSNGGVFITCNYNPAGNVPGERPY